MGVPTGRLTSEAEGASAPPPPEELPQPQRLALADPLAVVSAALRGAARSGHSGVAEAASLLLAALLAADASRQARSLQAPACHGSLNHTPSATLARDTR